MTNPFSHLEDEKLMQLYIDGENMAFEIIYSRYKSHVYSYLQKRISDKNIIDDIFQSIFIKFHKSRKIYDPNYPLLQWIYTISRSELLDTLKKKKVVLIPIKEDDIVTEPQENINSFDLDAEKLLSKKEKEALKYRYFSEKTYQEISNILKISEANSRKIISRGLKKLRTKYRGGQNE